MKFTKIELGPTHIEHINRPFPCYFGIDKTYKLFGHPFGLRLNVGRHLILNNSGHVNLDI